MRNTARLLIATLIAMTAATSAFAWGQREQDTLRGIIIGGVIAHHYPYAQPVVPAYPVAPVVPAAPVYQVAPVHPPQYYPAIPIMEPAPVCRQVPLFDYSGRFYRYQTVCH